MKWSNSSLNPKSYCLVKTLTSETIAGDKIALTRNSTKKLAVITALTTPVNEPNISPKNIVAPTMNNPVLITGTTNAATMIPAANNTFLLLVSVVFFAIVANNLNNKPDTKPAIADFKI